jgi:CHAT domain-containing protein
MGDLRILVVDDGPEWLEQISTILLRLGNTVKVEVALSYYEAIDAIHKHEYDLNTTDVVLSGAFSSILPDDQPDQMGMDLLRDIRSSQYNKDCALVVLTAYGTPLLMNQAYLKYGIHNFVEKDNFNTQNFLEVVRTAIKRARIKAAESRARRRWKLEILFNKDARISCNLYDPHQVRVFQYIASDPVHFRFNDLARRTDNLNTFLQDNDYNAWRQEARSIGNALYEALSAEQGIQKGLNAAEIHSHLPGDIWLQFSVYADNLAIPFELLHNGDDFLGHTHILTRYLQRTTPHTGQRVPFYLFLEELLERNEKLRMLIIGTNGYGDIQEAEPEALKLCERIDEDLKLLDIPHEITALIGDDATYVKVSDVLRSGHHHIFHYAGHGHYSDSLPENSALRLSDGKLTASMLNSLLRNSDLHLVFLSSCQGGRSGSRGRGDLHGLMEAVANANVPTVVGYRWSVADDSALNLAQDFYETLWRTLSPGEALLTARIRATHGPLGRDDDTWLSPILLMQTP